MQREHTLFEISWEVCNKIGGIHTVISSKLSQIQKIFSNYYTVGPYLDSSKENMVLEELPDYFCGARDRLLEKGINIHYGTWNVEQKPKVILVEWQGISHKNDEIKGHLWDKYGIDSLGSDWNDFDNAILWSWACGMVIEELMKEVYGDVLVHAHEWMSGGAIFQLKSLPETKFKTVFTTHATMLGRSIAGGGEDLYSILESIDPNQKAYEKGVHTKHQTEKALAHIADCFTTVSQITNSEAKQFYNKEADMILFNGFDNSTIPNLDELNLLYSQSNNKTKKFVEEFFKPYYNFQTENMKLFFTSGRNEIRNKGVDLYVKALGRLNQKLIQEEADVVVMNFMLIMTGQFEKINNENEKGLEFAPLSTHYVNQDYEIMRLFLENGLTNSVYDKVKVLFVPNELKLDDANFNRDYYEFTSGFDLGVFASGYEPWGYTPQESISYAVPTLTSDQSGFGKSIPSTCGDACPSVQVLKRLEKNDEETIEELTKILYRYAKQGKKQQQFERGVAKWLALKYDWEKFIENYLMAYDIALSK